MGNTFVRRSSKVGLVLSLALVFGLFLGVLPASASAAATASVNIHNVLAGQDGKVFSITVTNSEPMALLGGRTINRILITPPVDLMEASSTPTDHSASGWTPETFGSDPTVIRFKPTGGGLAPATSATFNIAADVHNTLSADAGDTWLIRVSSDTGNTTLKATGAGNALLTQVRVLQAQNIAVVSPAGAADDRDADGNPEVTGTQGNVCVRTRVFNASANTLTVTPAVSAPGVTFGPARPTGGADCSGAPLAGGSAPIAGGGSADFDFLAEFGNVGSRTNRNLKATASAPGACTPDTSGTCMPNQGGADDVFVAARVVAVEPKADISYVANSLSPRVVSPGSTGKVFTLRINKGPAQSPPLNPFAGDFQSAFGNTTVASPTSIDGGQRLDQTVTYNPFNIAAIEDDRYPVNVRFGYTDANGLVQPLTAPGGAALELVRLDSLIPVVGIDLTPPASQVDADPPVEPAVTNGQAFDVTGTVQDTDPATDSLAPCGPAPAAMYCELDKVELIQFPGPANAPGTPLAERIDITSDCTLNALGQINCADITVDFAAGVQSTQAYALASDEAELPGEDLDLAVDVDNVVPFLQDALATRGPVAGQRRAINVPFNEAVQDSNQALDWACQDGSAKPIAAVTQPADKRSVNLVTGTDLHADVPGGTCTYSPTVVSSPYHDRVGLDVDVVPPPVVALTDGIAPLAPTFESVNGNVAQEDGNYYFNTSSVEIALSNGTASADDPAIDEGYDVEVYKESNGEDGLQRTGDSLLCSDTSEETAEEGGDVTLTCNFGAAEGEADVYAITVDGNGNVGDISLATLILDMTRPIFDSATVAGAQITVTFSEALRNGDNRAQDWHFFGLRSNGNRKEFNLSAVAGTGIARTLTISDAEYNTTDFTPHSIRYVFKGDGVRYSDRAGNELLDIPEGLIG